MKVLLKQQVQMLNQVKKNLKIKPNRKKETDDAKGNYKSFINGEPDEKKTVKNQKISIKKKN